ncbi:uncharacterized protein PAC_14092 [Phialocephala subalpina]|uniref:Oxidase ustYa n=1 Tax=Phialocephala subalpina TaxID=576137 RepID=A0A1L7XGP8_9HELO|nr:uncharacterized protein PAC_14092 [Phialocephala subalpina]
MRMDAQYSKLHENYGHEEPSIPKDILTHDVTTSRRKSVIWGTLALAYMCGIVTVVGLLLLKRSLAQQIEVLRPLGDSPFFFEANETFAALPSPQSDQAWRDLSPSKTPWHVAHCLEYLRNALLCHADTNLEYTQHSRSERGAMAGFDTKTPHMCRDYSKVFQFAERWRVYDGKDMGERRPIENEEGREIHYVDLEEVNSASI